MSNSVVTAEMLRQRGACAAQVAVFRAAWPRGICPSLAACEKAARLGLNLDWFADHCLPAPARQAYEAAMATAWQAYEAAKATALWRVIREHGINWPKENT